MIIRKLTLSEVSGSERPGLAMMQSSTIPPWKEDKSFQDRTLSSWSQISFSGIILQPLDTLLLLFRCVQKTLFHPEYTFSVEAWAKPIFSSLRRILRISEAHQSPPESTMPPLFLFSVFWYTSPQCRSSPAAALFCSESIQIPEWRSPSPRLKTFFSRTNPIHIGSIVTSSACRMSASFPGWGVVSTFVLCIGLPVSRFAYSAWLWLRLSTLSEAVLLSAIHTTRLWINSSTWGT